MISPKLLANMRRPLGEIPADEALALAKEIIRKKRQEQPQIEVARFGSAI